MASLNSTVDGMGFEEVNQASFTYMISGNHIYGRTVDALLISGADIYATDNVVSDRIYGDEYVSGLLIKAVTISGADIVNSKGLLQSTSIENATELFGRRVKAGSILMGDDASGLINFKTPFTGSNWFIALTPTTYGAPQWSRTGSTGVYAVSGLKRTSGCWIVGGSKTVVDWIAVGI